ncbi:MAG: class I SAM-dependent methyltransferase, partial [Armatimonadetes bacterium]|nr:class I SAM-dependent methyltransferase [Armatimonadota bacterium]
GRAMVRSHVKSEADRLQHQLEGIVDASALRVERHSEALQATYRCLSGHWPMPVMGGARVAADLAALLVDHILSHAPVVICEFGSGLSTVLLAAAARMASTRDGAARRVVSFDHDERYAEETRQLVRVYGLDAIVQVVHAPLERYRDAQGNDCCSYDRRMLAHHVSRPVDLLFVDGPPRLLTATGRRDSVMQLAPMLGDRATLIFDDAHRDRALIEQLEEVLKVRKARLVDLAKGAAVLSLAGSANER